MLTVYRILTRLGHAALYPYARYKAARGERMWRDRLGLEIENLSADLWVHAASVGEVKVLAHLIDYIRKSQPQVRILLSVVTRAGFQTARELFGDSVFIRYLPVDVAPVVRRALNAVRPRCLVIAETEIWPNLITEAHRAGVPIVLVNGRMSAKAFSRYRLIGFFLSSLLKQYDRLFFKTEEDASRYAHFDLSPDKYEITGDMKFDAPVEPRSEGRIREIRYRLGAGQDDFVLVAGSTRPGEEAQLLGAVDKLSSEKRRCCLVLAPRHLERLDEVKQLCIDAGVEYAIYGHAATEVPVILVDRMGVLVELYLAADLAFVGGTLVDLGGHNILEPVWAGTPVLFGPSLDNVADAARYIMAHNFGMRVADIDEFIQAAQRVRDGDLTFAQKKSNDLRHSATGVAGDYILRKLDYGRS